MKYSLKGIGVDELSLKISHLPVPPNTKVEPQISRRSEIKEIDGKKVTLVFLSLKLEANEQNPAYYNLNATVVGIAEHVDEKYSEAEYRDMVIAITNGIYPHLCAAINTLTAQAHVPPLPMPFFDGPIFPEDRDVYTFQPGKLS